MKRIISLLLLLCLLLGLAGCGEENTAKKKTEPSEAEPTAPTEPYVPLEPYTYTDLPTALAAEKVATIPQRSMKTSNGGLYYTKDSLYGVITFDGKVDSGLVYTICQPEDRYFIVAKEEVDITGEITGSNVVGLVDASGKEIIPLQYASVEVLGDRFARVAELTGTTENSEEKLTQVTMDGKPVMCTGNWYLYDLQTGEKVPGATGTKPYISFDCGGYVKYVLDDKTVVTALPDGTPIPNDVVHLKNGHYMTKADYTVYDSEGTKLFVCDPEGYVPVDSEGFEGYILAQKEDGKKASYVLLDKTGNVASSVFEQKPTMYGDLFRVGDDLVTIKGDVVVKGGCQLVFWDALYGKTWAVMSGKVNKVVDKTGKVIFEAKAEDNAALDNVQMVCYKESDGIKKYYSCKDKDFTLAGSAVAPFVVRVLNGDNYDLINVLTGEVILSGYRDYMVTDGGDTIMYVYARTEDKQYDVFAVR